MDVYEISSEKEKLQGVGLRAKLKQTGKDYDIELTAENLPNNKVRFTVSEGTNIWPIIEFLSICRPDSKVRKIEDETQKREERTD
jgi:acylphosphatase